MQEVQHLKGTYTAILRGVYQILSTVINLALTASLLQTLLQSQGCAGYLSFMSVLLMLLTSLVGAKVGYWCFFSLWSVLHLSYLDTEVQVSVFSVTLLVVVPLSTDNFIPLLCSCRSNSKSSPEGYEGRRINYIPCKKPSAGINAWLAPKFSVPFLYHASLFYWQPCVIFLQKYRTVQHRSESSGGPSVSLCYNIRLSVWRHPASYNNVFRITAYRAMQSNYFLVSWIKL